MLTFEEWIKLPNDEEREKRYKELSDKDKFKVRQGFYYFGDKSSSLKPDFDFEIPDFLKDLKNISTQK